MTSEQFKRARLKLGLTQAGLGKRMSIRQPHISRIESGERQPTKGQAAHISNLQRWKDGEKFPVPVKYK